MRSITGMRLFSSISGWWCLLSFLLIGMLLVPLSEVSAQTDTPTPPFVTGVPPTATPPQGGNGQMSEIGFNFQQGEAGFNSLFGAWQPGIGIVTELGGLHIFGGFGMTEVGEVELYYTSDDSGDMRLRLCPSADTACPSPVYDQTAPIPACPDGCSYTFLPPSPDIVLIIVSFETDSEPDGFLALRGMIVRFFGQAEEFPVTDGCPLMDPTEMALLDPSYRASCSRCFSTVVPPFAQNVSTAAPMTARPSLNPTVQGTYSIPIVVTAGGTASFITATSWANPTITRTPSPTPTSMFPPTWTPNPSQSQQTFYVCAPSTCLPDAALNPFDDQGQYDSQTRRIGPGGVRINLTSWRWVYSVTVRYKYVNPSWISMRVEAQSQVGVTANINTNNPNQLRDTGAGFTAPVFSNYVDLMPVNDNGGNTIRTQLIIVNYAAASTPLPVASPTPTLAPSVEWVQEPTFEPVDCEVPRFRNATPVAEFPESFAIVSYECYTIIPEINISAFDFVMDGLNFCITWFEMPVIELLGITVSLDWLLVVVIAYLVDMILKL